MFGSARLLADLNEPLIDQQVSKGRLTETRGFGAKTAIRKGAINQSVIDGVIGASIHWGGEKFFHYQYLYDWSFQAMPYEAAIVFNTWFFFANAGAIPYFIPRSLWELRKIGRERSLTKRDILVQATAVGSNLMPVVSVLSTPLLNYPRAEDFFGLLISEKWGKITGPFRRTEKSPSL